MRRAAAKQHPIRHNDGGAATRLQQPQKQRQKEQLRLLRLHRRQQIFGRAFIIQTARKRRVGQNKAVQILHATMPLRQAVAVLNQRVFDAVQQHVHGGDAQHGAVKIETVEHLALVVTAAQLGAAVVVV